MNGGVLSAGDAVCITGATKTPREELGARASGAGLRVTSAVSRKTQLVVAADPDSESAKARRAPTPPGRRRTSWRRSGGSSTGP